MKEKEMQKIIKKHEKLQKLMRSAEKALYSARSQLKELSIEYPEYREAFEMLPRSIEISLAEGKTREVLRNLVSQHIFNQ